MQSEAHCNKTISLFALHRTQWKAPRRITLKLKRSVSQLSLAWKSGTSTCSEDTTSQYIQIINRSRQSSRSLSGKPLDDCSEGCSSYKDINFQFDTRKERNFILPTFCLVHLSLIILQQPVWGRNTKCSGWIWLRWKIEPHRVTSETMQRIKQETAKDPVLASLCNVLTRREAPEQLRQYWSFRDEISLYDGVANRSHQVIVPSSLREEMLQKIHKVHQRAGSSIRRACESLLCLECKQKSRKNAFLLNFLPNTLTSDHKNWWNLTQYLPEHGQK